MSEPHTLSLFVPGRICLFGEHSDWAGGYRRFDSSFEKGLCLVCGTDQGISARVSAHPTSLVLRSTDNAGNRVGPHSIPMVPDLLRKEAAAGGFWSYAAGVAYQVLRAHKVRGVTIDNWKTDLPIKKGLSSSAAICVLTARAFNRVYDLKLTIRGEMELAYQGEILTPSRCGRMDQACAFGSRPVLMGFDGDLLDTRELRVQRPLHYVVVDLHATKDTMRILASLNRCFPRPQNDVERGVVELLGPINKRIVERASVLLEQGEAEVAEELGALMVQAQREFDRLAAPACPEELCAPVLHSLLNHPALAPHIFGAKGVGSQGDGTAQILARSAADQEEVVRIVEEDLKMDTLKLTLQPVRRVRKAIIPAAGFGAHVFPASKATKKEFFPFVVNGICKPAFLLLVEEALDAGIEDVVIVVQQEDLASFQFFFQEHLRPENKNRLPKHLKDYADRLLEIGRHVHFVVQKMQEGLGHAVLCARDTIGNEPFLLMLGDHVYRSSCGVSCAGQLLAAYQQYAGCVVGLKKTPERVLPLFGAVTGVWEVEDLVLMVTEFVEKPNSEYARNNLHVTGLADDEFLTLFGQYVLTPNIFDYLQELQRQNVRQHGEFQLTLALERLRHEHEARGLMVEGRRYHFGTPDAYVQALREFTDGQ